MKSRMQSVGTPINKGNEMSNADLHSIAIAEAIVQKREFTMIRYSDGTPTNAYWHAADRAAITEAEGR